MPDPYHLGQTVFANLPGERFSRIGTIAGAVLAGANAAPAWPVDFGSHEGGVKLVDEPRIRATAARPAPALCPLTSAL